MRNKKTKHDLGFGWEEFSRQVESSVILDKLEQRFGHTDVGNERYVHLYRPGTDGNDEVVEAVKANDVARAVAADDDVVRVPVYTIRITGATGDTNWSKIARDVNDDRYNP